MTITGKMVARFVCINSIIIICALELYNFLTNQPFNWVSFIGLSVCALVLVILKNTEQMNQ